MLQYFDTLTDDSGNSLLGATVVVTTYPAGSPAPIYLGNGTTQPIANSTVVADITGQVSFYAPDGAYTLTYSYKGAVYKTRSPVQMLDPMSFVAATDSGTANQLVVSGSQYPAQKYVGLKLEVKVAATNTGSSSMIYNGDPGSPIVLPGGSGLAAGQVQAQGLARFEWDGAHWQLFGAQSVPFYAITAAEQAAGITPSNTSYPPYNLLRYGAAGNGTTDDTAAVQTGMTAAVASNSPLIVPYGTYLINGATLAIPQGNFWMEGQGKPTFLVSNVTLKSSTTEQSLTAQTIISAACGGTNYAAINGILSIKNCAFKNTDTSGTATRVLFAVGVLSQSVIEDCDFIGFTVCGIIGQYIALAGVNPDSDAQTAVTHGSYRRNYLFSDSINTGQCPKFFHLWCHVGVAVEHNELWGNGANASYILRVFGGNFDVVPVVGRGSSNIRISDNKFWTACTGSEWNQCVKSSNITIANNTFDASTGAAPEQFFDLFNCFSVAFTGNSGVGGGLCFFGHADLNNSAYPSTLVGCHGFSATGNTILNPTTPTGIFSFGGDGTESGNRASHKYTVVGNTVSTLPGFSANANCSFVYAFIGNDYVISNNNVENIPTFITIFFVLNLNITHNIISNVPTCVNNTGNDGSHQHFGNTYLGTTGNTNTFEVALPNGSPFGANVGLANIYTTRSNSGFGTGESTTVALPYSANVPAYLVVAIFNNGSTSGGQVGAIFLAAGSASGIELSLLGPATAPSGLSVTVSNSGGIGTVTASYSGNGIVILNAMRLF